MAKNVAIVFTLKSVDHLLWKGGTASWRLDRNHARACEFVVCTRNARHPDAEGTEAHQAAFLVGKIKDVVRDPTDKREDRYLIQFDDYALVNVPDVWKGDRNPVRYAESLEALGIDPSTLKWKPMPEQQQPAPSATPSSMPKGLTIPEAKLGLSLAFGVPPEAIDITIRG
jgi:hypothetical protein